MATRTRTHTYITFADPNLICGLCWRPVPRWHDPDKCGCSSTEYNDPCGCRAGALSTCPSWSPVDGCRCEGSPHDD